MTRSRGAAGVSRRLLVNGEALRVSVTAPRLGGGDKYEPRTAEEARTLLIPQLQAVLQTTQSLDASLRSARDIYVEARLLPNYIAASHFPGSLLDEIGAVPVGSRADQAIYKTAAKEIKTGTRRLILAVNDQGLLDLQELVNNHGGRTRTSQNAFSEIRKLDEISVAQPDSVVLGRLETGAELATWEAILHPAAGHGGQSVPLDSETMHKWFSLIESVGGRVYSDYLRPVGGLTFCPVALTDEAAVSVARFNPLRAIRPMPSIRPRPRFSARNTTRVQPPVSTAPLQGFPSVAIFDGGLDQPSKVIVPRSATDLTSEPPDKDDTGHGTGVAGAVLCGFVAPGDVAPRPSLPVDSYRVLPAPYIPGDLDGYWVLDQIKQAVIDGGHKIVNLSLGPTLAVEDAMEPNRWTAELDELAWEHQVLFVVAAGNDGDADQATGLHRVQVPGDMANGLTVGACDAIAPTRRWERASYSSMGPGRQGNLVQPVGVQFGGDSNNKFPVLRADGSFWDACGTSFAAPLVTHALADLTTRLPQAGPSVLRAFATHFAERHRTFRKVKDEVGYGRLPLTFDRHLECDENEVHVLYSDRIERGELLGYQAPIPVVDGDVQVMVTLAYASPVEPSQPTEYTNASLGLVLRPHERKFSFSPARGQVGKSVSLDVASPEARRLLDMGWRMGQEPIVKSFTQGGPMPEQQLRDNGKWETLRHYRLTLRAGEFFEPRFEVSYLARRAGALDNAPAAIPFALLISVVGKAGSEGVYDKTVAQFAALRPVQQIAGQVRVRNMKAGKWE